MRAWLLIALAAAVAAVVALVVWFASRDTAAPGGVSQTAQAGELHVTVQLDQAALGPRVLQVDVKDAAGELVEPSAVRLRFSMAEMDMGQLEADAQVLGRGR